MLPGNGRRGPLALGTMVGLFLCSLVFGAVGVFMLWSQNSGFSARITVESCSEASMPVCSGALRHHEPNGECADRQIPIVGTGSDSVGRDVDVHVDGSCSAIVDTDKFPVPLMMIAAGILSGIGAEVAAVARVRNSHRWLDVSVRSDGSELVPAQ